MGERGGPITAALRDFAEADFPERLRVWEVSNQPKAKAIQDVLNSVGPPARYFAKRNGGIKVIHDVADDPEIEFESRGIRRQPNLKQDDRSIANRVTVEYAASVGTSATSKVGDWTGNATADTTATVTLTGTGGNYYLAEVVRTFVSQPYPILRIVSVDGTGATVEITVGGGNAVTSFEIWAETTTPGDVDIDEETFVSAGATVTRQIRELPKSIKVLEGIHTDDISAIANRYLEAFDHGVETLHWSTWADDNANQALVRELALAKLISVPVRPMNVAEIGYVSRLLWEWERTRAQVDVTMVDTSRVDPLDPEERLEWVLHNLSELGTYFAYTAFPPAGGWVELASGSSSLADTGPSLNNSLPCVLAALSGGFNKSWNANSELVMRPQYVLLLAGKTITVRCSLQGLNFRSTPARAFMILEGRVDITDVWTEIEEFYGTHLFDYQSEDAGDNLTDLDGEQYNIVADGGWRDVQASIPAGFTELRFRFDYRDSNFPGASVLHQQIALRSISAGRNAFEWRFSALGDFNRHFSFPSGFDDGHWQAQDNGSTSSNSTGPSTNNADAFVHTEASANSGEPSMETNGVATVQSDDVATLVNREIIIRYCMQGAFAGSPLQSLRLQGKNTGEADWTDIATLHGWAYAASHDEGDSGTDYNGDAFKVARDGGWRDATVSVGSYDELRFAPDYTGGSIRQDIALYSIRSA